MSGINVRRQIPCPAGFSESVRRPRVLSKAPLSLPVVSSPIPYIGFFYDKTERMFDIADIPFARVSEEEKKIYVARIKETVSEKR
jgi:hypothetical protein